MGVWKIGSGETKRLSDTVEAESWTWNSYRAQSFLLSNIDESLTPLITLAEDACQAWTILEDKLDRKTVTKLSSTVY
jgi:hypothetical protein